MINKLNPLAKSNAHPESIVTNNKDDGGTYKLSNSEKPSAKWEGPDFDAAKNIENASHALARDSKGERKISGDLRRSEIDQDLDQSKQSIKQQILEYPGGNH
jgi:hypothetical protein